MVTNPVISLMRKMIIDIHCHVLFGVDDGAKTLEESLKMLRIAVSQGVEAMVLTPHVHSHVTRASRKTRQEHFQMLKQAIAAEDIPIQIHLGAEINYRSHLEIDYEKHVFEGTKTILIEFSTHDPNPIEDIVFNLIKKGYTVVVAHVERYDDYMHEIDYVALKHAGAILQVNGSSILGYEAKQHKKIIKFLLSKQLIDVIASDAHDAQNRKPDLISIYDFLSKKHDLDYLDRIFYHNPKKLIKD